MLNLQERVSRKLTEAVTLAQYRLNQLKHVRKKPLIGSLGRRIVADLKAEGISVTSIEELGLASNPALLQAIERANEDLDQLSAAARDEIEYQSGFLHCVPINPSQIATKYPALYTWGLDDKLLDLMENCLGLPVAYHGVCVRKELVDGQQVGSRVWHLDSEDFNTIRILIYLSDVVDDEAGPFEYIPRRLSPTWRDFKGIEGAIFDADMRKVVPESEWRRCYGPAGTVVFGAVTKIFHHGKLPQKPRKLASYYYTSRAPSDEELTREFSFESGMHLLNVPLTARQRECLWKYKELLP